MFKDHNKALNTFIQASPDNLFRAGLFVISSIRQPLSTLENQLADIYINKENSKHLWGFKYQSYLDLVEHKQFLYDELLKLYHSDLDNYLDNALVLIADNITGLGLVKAGFLIQLAFGEIGCIDSRNKEQFGITRNTLRYAKNTSLDIRLNKAFKYRKLSASIGPCSFLWDNWCTELALSSPETYINGHEVSKSHLDIIQGIKI